MIRMLLTLVLRFSLSLSVSGIRTVRVTGFDNHSNRSIARLVEIPVPSETNSLDRQSNLKTHIAGHHGVHSSRSAENSFRLCRHVEDQGGRKVSNCWPGLDCGADLVEEEEHSENLLFLDSCWKDADGRKHCSTEFVKSCPEPTKKIDIENRVKEKQNKNMAPGFKLPRIIEETLMTNEESRIPTRRIILGLKSNRRIEKEKIKVNANSIGNERHVINRYHINPNIIVRYLNKEKHAQIINKEAEYSNTSQSPSEMKYKNNKTMVDPLNFKALESDTDFETISEKISNSEEKMTTTEKTAIQEENLTNNENTEQDISSNTDDKDAVVETHADFPDTEIKDNDNIHLIHDEVGRFTTRGPSLNETQDTSMEVENDITTLEMHAEAEITTETGITETHEMNNYSSELYIVGTEKTTKLEMTTDTILPDNQDMLSKVQQNLENVVYKEEEEVLVPTKEKIKSDTQNMVTNLGDEIINDIILFDENTDLRQIVVSETDTYLEDISIMDSNDIVNSILSNKVDETPGSNLELPEMNVNEEDDSQLEFKTNTAVNISYILDVLKDIQISEDETTVNLKDINQEYNVRKMIEEENTNTDATQIGKDNLVEEDLEEYFVLDADHEDNHENPEKGITKNLTDQMESDEESTTVDMYAGDVDILFGL